MSCNGCRVLRKGCSESCMLRPCLQWIDTPQAQAHATVFVAKFFGRAGLMSFLSNVPSHHRPALFQSLLYEACGRTVNPVTGAVGLLWTGNWHVCQAAVDTVLGGGTLRPIPDLLVGAPPIPPTATTTDTGDVSEVNCSQHYKQIPPTNSPLPRFTNSKRRRFGDENTTPVDLTLAPGAYPHAPKQRPGTPSLNSEESAATISFEGGGGGGLECYDINRPIQVDPRDEIRLLNLFV